MLRYSQSVVSTQPVHASILKDQIQILLKHYPIAAIKTGMLYSKENIIAVSKLLENTTIPLVVDPIILSTSGTPLLEKDAVSTYQETLFPLATLITPNIPEAEELTGESISSIDTMEQAAHLLSKKFNAAILLKGGHLKKEQQHTDVLAHQGETYHYTHKHIEIPHTHGTGCVLSAAITAHLANGIPLTNAIEQAGNYLHQTIVQSHQWNDTFALATLPPPNSL